MSKRLEATLFVQRYAGFVDPKVRLLRTADLHLGLLRPVSTHSPPVHMAIIGG